jgi:hypothetical protein
VGRVCCYARDTKQEAMVGFKHEIGTDSEPAPQVQQVIAKKMAERNTPASGWISGLLFVGKEDHGVQAADLLAHLSYVQHVNGWRARSWEDLLLRGLLADFAKRRPHHVKIFKESDFNMIHEAKMRSLRKQRQGRP